MKSEDEEQLEKTCKSRILADISANRLILLPFEILLSKRIYYPYLEQTKQNGAIYLHWIYGTKSARLNRTELDLSRRKKGSPKVYLLRFYVFKARHAPTRTSFTTSRLLFGRLSDEEQLWRLSGFSVSCITGPVQKIETFPNRTRLAEEITTMSCKQRLIIVLSSAK